MPGKNIARDERMFSPRAGGKTEDERREKFVTNEELEKETAEEKGVLRSARKVVNKSRIKQAQKKRAEEIVDETQIGLEKAKALEISEDEYLKKREAQANTEALSAKIKDLKKKILALESELDELKVERDEKKRGMGLFGLRFLLSQERIELEKAIDKDELEILKAKEELDAIETLIKKDTKTIETYEQMVQNAKIANKKAASYD